MRTISDEVVDTSYGYFELSWGDGSNTGGILYDLFTGQVNGLVGAADPEGVYVNLARYGGGSPVLIVACEESPGPAARWPARHPVPIG